MLAVKTGPILPMIFDGMIQTAAVIWAKNISGAFGVNRILVLIHGSIPLAASLFQYIEKHIPFIWSYSKTMPQCSTLGI
jgi:hypothetical protein